MSIETEYRGYKLTFDETSEKWSCRGLDIEECISLKACRAAVDRLSAADRRLNVKALVLEGRSERHTIKEVVVTILCEPKKGWGQTAPAVSKVWTMRDGLDRGIVVYAGLALVLFWLGGKRAENLTDRQP